MGWRRFAKASQPTSPRRVHSLCRGSTACSPRRSARAGEVETALETLDRALAAVERNGERWFEAELYRLRGEMSLRFGPRQARRRGRPRTPESAAEVCFWSAIDVARRQVAKSWELRAATSLGRLRQRQGRVQEARKALADVYGWLTEGLDTPDLQAARSLLAELT